MTCKVCSKRSYSEYCFLHKPRKPIDRNKNPNKQSKKEQSYQVWKESFARPYLIERDGNRCSCFNRQARDGEKLDIEHSLSKGSRPDLKQDLNNLTLMCRYPCHRLKTDGIECNH